jgi:hypothetical protein
MRLLTKLPVAVGILLLIATALAAQPPQPLALRVLNQQSPALTAERGNLPVGVRHTAAANAV